VSRKTCSKTDGQVLVNPRGVALHHSTVAQRHLIAFETLKTNFSISKRMIGGTAAMHVFFSAILT
jgi:hypothetical protein